MLKTAGNWEADNLPTARGRLIPPNQVFLVFRSNGEGNTWNEICDLTERLLKRFTKYGWCFSLPDRAHSSLQSAKMGVLRFQEQRALGGVLRQKELPVTLILPGPNGSVGKESACNAGELRSFPGLGRSPGEVNGNPLQYSCLKNPMDREAWWAAVHGVARVRHNRATKYMLSIFLDSCLEIRSQCRGHPLSLRTSQIRKQASHIPKH